MPKHTKHFEKWEIDVIKEKYQTCSWDEILSCLPHRNKESIIHKAYELKLKKDNYYWTNNDIEILIQGYKNNVSNEKIRKMLNDKFSIQSINTKANKLGLLKRQRWTSEEIEILINNYSMIPIDAICELLPNRKRQNIIAKAKKMNINSYQYLKEQWTNNDIDFLLSNYKAMSDEKIANALGRSVDSVRGKRDRMHLFKPIHNGVYNYLSEYIRKRNKQWKKDSSKKCNYQCIVTGNRFQAIHHLYGMNLILNETLEELKISDKEKFDDYTQDELERILNHFYIVQARYPLGVCLTKEIHKQFHDIYGYGNNTPEQFEEFLYKFNNKKINKVA